MKALTNMTSIQMTISSQLHDEQNTSSQCGQHDDAVDVDNATIELGKYAGQRHSRWQRHRHRKQLQKFVYYDIYCELF